jgi:hypothetical protein
MELDIPQFVTSAPSHQNAADIFKGRWVCHVPADGILTGGMQLFSPEDRRPQMVVDVCGSIEGFKVLELGPLEGGHTYQLERLGAGSILAIDASPEFYLKSLITKEMLGLRAKYQLGDFIRYLEETEERYDLVFASGVLYHMIDPLHALYLISRVTPRVFIWSHYVAVGNGMPETPVERHGYRCDYFEVYYNQKSHSRGFSGVMPSACRLKQRDIVESLKFFGFDRVTVTEDTPDHPGGPAVSLVAEKTG